MIARTWNYKNVPEAQSQVPSGALPKLEVVGCLNWHPSRKPGRRMSLSPEVDASTAKKLAADLTRPFGQSTGRGFSLTRFKMSNYYRSLIMPGRAITPRTLYEISHIVTSADPICGHLRWSDEYPFLVLQMARSGLDQHLTEQEAHQVADFSQPITALNRQVTPLSAETAHIHKRLRCALFHKASCTCLDSIPFNAIRSCPRCHTDYTVSVVSDSIPGWPEARLLVFTTWKFLGVCNDQDYFWSSHITSGPPKRVYSPGYMHYCFESQPQDHNTYAIDIGDIQARVALARQRQREANPQYTAVETSSPDRTSFDDPPRLVRSLVRLK
ncbi:hypothetical protein B0T26DRAFT_788058 [Lasiosphaeria miniovina]|uniref:Uncharacterized protein n=1 Tax=Lasiosphaeria miniovina TaxID=1954250 RepID=A0AA39ZYR1_9PEZI|nr:uncharacterized protein B0T26DRAFT_788058 [Lasiosphaeria miniovina]KAK0705909.1 hypothetical protein B0T26DRAFT_788058 [Lasiosphaeria miniovina]